MTRYILRFRDGSVNTYKKIGNFADDFEASTGAQAYERTEAGETPVLRDDLPRLFNGKGPAKVELGKPVVQKK